MNAVVEDVRDVHQFTSKHFYNMTHLWFRSNKIFCAFFAELTNFVKKVVSFADPNLWAPKERGGCWGVENLPYAIY